MPYLTLWDKISQNLAHLEANSQKIFQISQNLQTILQHIWWRNKHKSHCVMFITSFLHLNKGFWLFWGSSKVIFVKMSQNFIESPLKICLISQTSVYSLWHVCNWHNSTMSLNFWMQFPAKWFFLTALSVYYNYTKIVKSLSFDP